MTFTLYGNDRSGSAIVEALLAEAGAPVTLIDIDLNTNQQLGPDLFKVNPMARLPTLVMPEGHVLTESAAIVIALADRFPSKNLLPRPGTVEREKALRWLIFMSSNIYEAVSRVDFPARFTKAADPDAAEQIRLQAEADLRRLWLLFLKHAAPDPFVLGQVFSAADLYAAVLSRWCVGADWRAADAPGLDLLAAKVAERPRIAAIWQRHFGS